MAVGPQVPIHFKSSTYSVCKDGGQCGSFLSLSARFGTKISWLHQQGHKRGLTHFPLKALLCYGIGRAKCQHEKANVTPRKQNIFLKGNVAFVKNIIRARQIELLPAHVMAVANEIHGLLREVYTIF
jgi:hypothetical protein